MVMRGGGRNREIQRLQSAAAQNGGEGTARQAQRLEYLRNHPQAGRRPQGPQTGGPLQEAMGPGGQDAIRTQQPYQGGQMSNGGTTWNGQPPMSMDGRPIMKQPGNDPRGAMDAYNRMKQGGEGTMSPMQGQAYGGANMQGLQQLPGKSAPLTMEQQQEQIRKLQQEGKYIGFNPNQPPPMQRPTPGQNIDPGFALPGPMQRPTAQGPDYFRGQGMGMDRFNQPGYQAPQQPVQGDWFRGGGMGADRFSKFGAPAPMQRPVAGDQIRGGGSPGISRRRVNTNRGQSAGVLAPPPGKIVPY